MSQEKLNSSSPSFFNNPRNRAIIYQLILLLGLGYFFYSIVTNALENMRSQGIQTGYDFLDNPTGFDVLMKLIDYDSSDTYIRVFVVGLLNTILVSIIGIVLSTIVGFIMGVAHFSPNWLIRKAAIVYVEIFRNIPLLLQVFFWYGAVLASLPGARESLSIGEAIFLNIRGLYLPAFEGQAGSGFFWASIAVAIIAVVLLKRWAKKRQVVTGQQFPVLWVSLALLLGFPIFVLAVTGFPFTVELPALSGFNFRGGVTIIPELMALALSLTIYTGAFIAEAVRAGVQSVPNGQTEAARSIGLKESRIMSLIVVPQAMRVIVPLLNSEYQSLVKNSTLATAIGYPELFNIFVGTSLNVVGQAIEIIFMTIAVYFVINMTISLLMNVVNMSVKLKEAK